jgi:hypothetical protein
VKNANRGKCRWYAEAHVRQLPQRNLNGAFVATANCEYTTPMGALLKLRSCSSNYPKTQRLKG